MMVMNLIGNISDAGAQVRDSYFFDRLRRGLDNRLAVTVRVDGLVGAKVGLAAD